MAGKHHVAQIRDEAHCFEIFLRDPEFHVLLKNTAETGISLPSIVISNAENHNGYVVRDGNRRIAALKLLANPGLCPPSLIGKKGGIEARARANPPADVNAIDCFFTNDEKTLKEELTKVHHRQTREIGAEQTALLQAKEAYENGVSHFCRDAYAIIVYGRSHGFTLFKRTFAISHLQDFFVKAFVREVEYPHSSRQNLDHDRPPSAKTSTRPVTPCS